MLLIDLEKIKTRIEEGVSISKISKELEISSPTIRKYAVANFPFLINKIEKNALEGKAKANFKTGQQALYKKLRKECKEQLHACEKCGTKKNVEIHHKEKLIYNKNWANWKAPNFVNDLDKIIFLCNSCHQKKHYSELGRKCSLKRNKKGQFLKKVIN